MQQLFYSLELSDLFIKNENSVLPIVIEKNFEQKNLLLSLENEVYVFKRKEIQFFHLNLDRDTEIIFSTSCEKFKIFPFVLFENRRLAQGVRRTKAADSPLCKKLKNRIF